MLVEHPSTHVNQEIAARRSGNFSLGGLTVTARCVRGQHGPEVALAIAGVPGEEIRLDLEELRHADPTGLISRLEHRLTALDQRHADTLNQAARCRTEAHHATEQLGTPFPHADALTAARARAREIDTAMHTLAVEQQRAPATLSNEQPGFTPPADSPHQPSSDARRTPTIGPPRR